MPSDLPNFVVVSPSSGVTPALLWVGLDRNVVPYLPAGAHAISLQFAPPGQSCPSSSCGGTIIALSLSGRAAAVTSVLNAATLQPGICPGAIVSILGTNLSTPPITAHYDSAGLYPTSLGNTTVRFNDIAAPLLYVSTGQVNAVVPYGVAGQRTANIVVTHNRLASPAFSVPIVDTSPGIFTATAAGSGQGAILNQDGAPNSADNPAPRGSVIQLWATGGGVWNRNLQDGSIVLSPLFDMTRSGDVFLRPAAPVSLTIGGQPAEIRYAGPALYEVSGKLQVNAVVPDGIGSGPQPVVLTIGNNNNSQQQVTVAVQ